MRRLVIALALIPGRAHAGHHGGGGGSCSHSSSGGGGYSSGSSSSSSSTSSGSATESHACTESTDIEGYRECVSFGAWADNMIVPHIIMEIGSNVRQFSTELGGEGGSVTHGSETFTYRVAMPASARRAEVAMTMPARMAIGLGHGFYAGLEGEIGGLASPAPLSTEMLSTGTFGSPTLDLSSGVFLGGYGVAGVRGGNRWAALSAEVAGGVRTVEYRLDSHYHECEQTSTFDVTGGVVEARARAEVWVYPWVSVGATVGTSIVDRDDWMTGIYVGLHSRAYGGLR